MKYIIIIFFSFFIFSKDIQAGNDTCKNNTFKPSKLEIINTLYRCFVTANFDSLNIFCDEYIEFEIVGDSIITKEYVTDYKAIDNLNNIINYFKYIRFSIFSGINSKCEESILVRIFQFNNTNEFYVNIIFKINSNKAITVIIIN
jgi:hypothetical protein